MTTENNSDAVELINGIGVINHFCNAMKERFIQKHREGRRGWRTCPPEKLSELLQEQVQEGDTVATGVYAAMLFALNAEIVVPKSQTKVDPDKITVSAADLVVVLHALGGPGHRIRELQATRSLHGIAGTHNPIQSLVQQYNDWRQQEVQNAGG